MKSSRLFWFLTGAPLVLVPFAGGCVFLKAPEPAPTPTPAPTPKPPYFDAAAGQSRGTALNKLADPVLPDAFRISATTTGDTLLIQSLDTVKTGTPPKDVVTLGAPDTVKLAGIVAPTVDPGLQGARSAISSWTAGQNLDVDLDAKFPTDLDGNRIVHVFFKGRDLDSKGKPGRFAGQTLSLNRMLVRSGWAVVDLYSPTSFDTSQWLYDEAYARRNKLGFWRYGQAIQQRVPVKIKTGTGARSTVTIAPTTRGGAATTTKTTTTTTQTQITTNATGTTPAATAPVPPSVPPPATP